jgi:hypothetical protein
MQAVGRVSAAWGVEVACRVLEKGVRGFKELLDLPLGPIIRPV